MTVAELHDALCGAVRDFRDAPFTATAIEHLRTFSLTIADDLAVGPAGKDYARRILRAVDQFDGSPLSISAVDTLTSKLTTIAIDAEQATTTAFSMGALKAAHDDIAELRDELHALANRVEALTRAVAGRSAEVRS